MKIKKKEKMRRKRRLGIHGAAAKRTGAGKWRSGFKYRGGSGTDSGGPRNPGKKVKKKK